METRNVLNTAAVDRFLDELATLTARPELRNWLRSTVRLWLLNHHQRYDRVIRDPMDGRPARVDATDEWDAVPRPIEADLPLWCDDALARGDTVIWLRLGPALHKRVRCALAAVDRALERTLDETDRAMLDGLSFPAAEALDRQQRRADFEVSQRATKQATKRATQPAAAAAAQNPGPPGAGDAGIRISGAGKAPCPNWHDLEHNPVTSRRDPRPNPKGGQAGPEGGQERDRYA